MEITVDDESCWVCGRHKTMVNLTDHHTLPKHLNPKRNVVVPVCHSCHTKINRNDTKGIVQFAFKIEKTFGAMIPMVKNMIRNLKEKGGKSE